MVFCFWAPYGAFFVSKASFHNSKLKAQVPAIAQAHACGSASYYVPSTANADPADAADTAPVDAANSAHTDAADTAPLM